MSTLEIPKKACLIKESVIPDLLILLHKIIYDTQGNVKISWLEIHKI